MNQTIKNYLLYGFAIYGALALLYLIYTKVKKNGGVGGYDSLVTR